MLTVFTKVKVGVVSKNVEVCLYNTGDVAPMLGVSPIAVYFAARKAGVGIKDAGSMYFTREDIAILKKRPGRGRPRLNGVKVMEPKVTVVPQPMKEFTIFGIPTDVLDLGTPTDVDHNVIV